MNRTTLFIALYGLLMAPLALADDCRQHLPTWLELAHPGHAAGQPLQDERGSYHLDAEQSICKVWPARPQLTLVAVPLIRSVDGNQGESDLEVLVFSSDEHAIVARLVEPHRLDWDAIFVARLAFDTAPYRLRENELAFGVRVMRRNGSRPNLYRETLLNLYELDGQKLRPLLNELPVSGFWGEWDTRCAGEFSETKGVLIITEQVGRHGYRDLLLRVKRNERRDAEVEGECRTVEQSTHPSEFRLEYDEERYLLPIEFSPV